MSENNPADLIGPYLAGELDPTAAAAVRAYVEASPQRRLFMTGVQDSLRSRAAGAVPETEGSWQQLLDKLDRSIPNEALRSCAARPLSVPRGDGRGRRIPILRSRFSLGAVAGLAAGAIMIAMIAGLGGRGGMSDANPAKSVQSYAARVGEQRQLRLSDGSLIRLASGSRITVPAEFGATSRTVLLDGEAVFDVRNASATPFVVRTGAITTRVLGTLFGVRYDDTDHTVRVAVMRGKVAVTNARMPVTLVAGMVGEVSDSAATAATVANVQDYSAWTEGRLVFDDVPASEMLASVGQWYGVSFRMTDSTIAGRHVAAVFKLSARAETMVAIRRLLDVTMTVHGNTITLAPRTPSHETAAPARRSPTTMSTRTEVGK
jgi:transmembrane sensor